MARFKKRRSDGDDHSDVPEATGELTSRAAAYPTAPETASDPADGEAEAEVEASAAPETPENDLPRVGEHVASVLKAAEDAAARLVDEARAKADELREDAETTAARLRVEAQTAHSEAVVAAGEIRAAAEAEAARVRADAEQDAATFGERAATQHEDLLNDMALAEDRLRRLVDGLHEVADHLDSLLEDDEDEEPAASDNGDGASLVEALKPDGSARASAE
jgi:hypothetical protein